MKTSLILLLICLALMGQAQSITPKKEGSSKFSITCANLYFEIDSAMGARISSFKLDNNELINVATSVTENGSTFWPSPQSVWNWPPLVNLDSKPYKSAINRSKITFAGSIDTKTQLRFYKTMYANTIDTSIIIEYTMKNEKATSQSWAPWEITRVKGKGLTVFPKGEGSITGILAPSTDEQDGYVWYDQDKNIVNKSGTYKFNCDGKGWLAHVVGGNMVFIKKFEDIPKSSAAKDEAEVEVFTAFNNAFTELENQGAYTSIASKDSITWKVKWFARVLPASVNVSVGSKSLTDYIVSVLKRESEPASVIEKPTMGFIKVYPNPATEYLIVETNRPSFENISLWIYNLQGKVVLEQVVRQNNQQVAIKTLMNGNYVYDLKQNSKSIAKGQLSVKR